MFAQRVLNGCLGDLETQFEQFTFDFGITPTRVLPCQFEDQAFKRFIDRWSAASVFSLVSPLATNKLLMPGKNCVGLEQPNDRMQLDC